MAGGSASTDERIDVWRQVDGMWRWRHLLPGQAALVSAEVYESEQEAVRAAGRAYPGVAITRSALATDSTRAGRWALRAAALLAAVALLRGPLRLLRRLRRWRRWFNADR